MRAGRALRTCEGLPVYRLRSDFIVFHLVLQKSHSRVALDRPTKNAHAAELRNEHRWRDVRAIQAGAVESTAYLFQLIFSKIRSHLIGTTWTPPGKMRKDWPVKSRTLGPARNSASDPAVVP